MVGKMSRNPADGNVVDTACPKDQVGCLRARQTLFGRDLRKLVEPRFNKDLRAESNYHCGEHKKKIL
jgi:hypothetical protein